jgi:hypothetical protein
LRGWATSRSLAKGGLATMANEKTDKTMRIGFMMIKSVQF